MKMIRLRMLFYFIGVITLFYACNSPQQPLVSNSSHPNIILIVADDLGYDFLGCYGDNMAKTPHLDKLAQQGILFKNFYSNSPICSPSRAALLTGLYQQKTGVDKVIKKETKGMPSRVITLAERLQQLNYETGIFGKWHLGFQAEEHPLNQGFDHFFGPLTGHIDYISHRYNDGVHDLWENKTEVFKKGHFTNIVTEEAIEFIDQQKAKSFFLYLPYLAPHSPYILENESYLTGPEGKPAVDPFGGNISRYRDVIELLDKNIGKLYQHLQKRQLLDNTIIWFVSDNGEPLKVHNNYVPTMKGAKGLLLEGGIRVPSILYWKNTLGSKTVDRPVLGMDLMPTLLDFIDSSYIKNKLDGQSIKPLLLNYLDKKTNRKLFWKLKSAYAVRDENWKAVFVQTDQLNKNRLKMYFGNSRTPETLDSLIKNKEVYSFLYNLGEDPLEQNNLADTAPDKLLELQEALNNWKVTLPKDTN